MRREPRNGKSAEDVLRQFVSSVVSRSGLFYKFAVVVERKKNFNAKTAALDLDELVVPALLYTLSVEADSGEPGPPRRALITGTMSGVQVGIITELDKAAARLGKSNYVLESFLVRALRAVVEDPNATYAIEGSL